MIGMKFWRIVPLVLSLGGCAIGYDTVGAFTTTNIGVNVQATPTPVVEVSFARREGALEPTYEDGNLPAVAASIEFDVAGVFGFLSSNRSVFTGGNAAVLASGGNLDPSGLSAVACVTQQPARARIISDDSAKKAEWTTSTAITGTTLFVTDSTIGFKVGFPAGSDAPIPNVNLGYRRNEMALAPVFARKGGCSEEQLRRARGDANGATGQPQAREMWAIYTPSYIAVSSNGQRVDPLENGAKLSPVGFSARQIFATGKAAEEIAGGGAKGFLRNLAADVTGTSLEPTDVFVVRGMKGGSGSLSVEGRTEDGQTLDIVAYQVKPEDEPAGVANAMTNVFNAKLGAKGVSAFAAGDAILLRLPPGGAITWAVKSIPTMRLIRSN